MGRAVTADFTAPVEEPSKESGSGQREVHTCAACGTKFSATTQCRLCPVCALRRVLGDKAALDEALNPATGSDLSFNESEPEPLVHRLENYELMLDENGSPIELGRGAMGVTYKAFDVDLRCPVTLKVIGQRYLGDESARLRFLREARAAASVRHPNVASVLHLGRTGNS